VQAAEVAEALMDAIDEQPPWFGKVRRARRVEGGRIEGRGRVWRVEASGRGRALHNVQGTHCGPITYR